MDITLFVVILLLSGCGAYVYLDSKKQKELETLGTKVDKTTSVNSLKKLTKQQLFDLADKKGIKIKKSGTKADVIKQISSAK
jgi:uncharacterized protein YceK